MAAAVATALAVAAAPAPALAWSGDGHRVTALVALALLTPRARRGVLEALEGDNLAKVSTWADAVRNPGDGCVAPGNPGCAREYRPETAQWHFVNIPLAEARFDASAPYCRSTRAGDCIVLAIDDFRSFLRRSALHAPAASDEQRRRVRDAVAFLVHLVGDVHQPLHCADDGDGGGNEVLVTWRGAPRPRFGDAWTLHALWDDALVDRAIAASGRRTATGYAALLVERLTPDERAAARRAPAGNRDAAAAWAEESHAVARAVAYAFARPSGRDVVTLDDAYLDAAAPVVERRLRLAGIRLARVLNEVFDPR